MPTYEYKCKACGEALEVVQSFTDEALTVCPACEGPLRKVFGSIGITFKGSGFYKTDSRGSSGSSATKVGTDGAAKSDKSEKADSGSKSDSGSSSPSSSDSGSKSSDNGSKSDSSSSKSSDSGSKSTSSSGTSAA